MHRSVIDSFADSRSMIYKHLVFCMSEEIIPILQAYSRGQEYYDNRSTEEWIINNVTVMIHLAKMARY